MDQEFKAEWIAALRSGEYRQGVGALVRKKGGVEEFCCLGVACEIGVKKGILKRVEIEGTGSGYYGPVGYVGVSEFEDAIPENAGLPRALREAIDWEGDDSGALSDWYEEVDSEGLYSATKSLIGLNDELGKDFAFIADVIEQQF